MMTLLLVRLMGCWWYLGNAIGHPMPGLDSLGVDIGLRLFLSKDQR